MTSDDVRLILHWGGGYLRWISTSPSPWSLMVLELFSVSGFGIIYGKKYPRPRIDLSNASVSSSPLTHSLFVQRLENPFVATSPTGRLDCNQLMNAKFWREGLHFTFSCVSSCHGGFQSIIFVLFCNTCTDLSLQIFARIVIIMDLIPLLNNSDVSYYWWRKLIWNKNWIRIVLFSILIFLESNQRPYNRMTIKESHSL